MLGIITQKLVASVAGGKIDLAAVGLNDFGGELEEFIAPMVTVLIVDDLKPVKINHEEGKGLTVTERRSPRGVE